MRNTYLLILFFINLMLSACSKEEEYPDNTPAVILGYSIEVRLTDLTVNNLIAELPLEFLSEDSYAKLYAIKEGSFRFYYDGKEIVTQEEVEPYTYLYRCVVSPLDSCVSPCIRFLYSVSYTGIDEFLAGPQPTHTYEYRFTLPSILGEEEQVITIQCEARNFYTPACRKVFINGVESESDRINSFTLIVDKD